MSELWEVRPVPGVMRVSTTVNLKVEHTATGKVCWSVTVQDATSVDAALEIVAEAERKVARYLADRGQS